MLRSDAARCHASARAKSCARRRNAWSFALLLLASCGGEEAPVVERSFVVPVPAGAVVRHAQARGTRATTLLTTEAPIAEVVRFYEQDFARRGWRIERSFERGPRHRTQLRAMASAPVARVVIERGAAELTRATITIERPNAPIVVPAPEPREWRRIARPPLPAPLGEGHPECARAIQAACERWARAATDDELACALEHRAPCARAEPPDRARLADDAFARLREALRAHERVGSNAARTETRALIGLELTAAEIVAARFGDRTPALRALIDAAHAEGHRSEVSSSELARWFAPTTTIPRRSAAASLPR